MNRKDEYEEILSQMDDTPLKLEYTMQRVMNKYNAKKKRTFWKRLFSSVTACIITFAIVINVFPVVAFALNDIPVIGLLVKAVALDPSLKLAVENNHVQYVGQEKNIDGVDIKIQYIIADASRISIFYNANLPYNARVGRFQAFYENGDPILTGMQYGGEDIGKSFPLRADEKEKKDNKSNELYEMRMEMVEGYAVPEKIKIVMGYYDASLVENNVEVTGQIQKEKENKWEIDFDLVIDTKYTKAIRTIEINKELDLLGQKVIIEKLDIFPTQAKLKVVADANNTTIIKNISLYLEDAQGHQYGSKKNGIVRTHDNDKGRTTYYYLESNYFAKAKDLRLIIDGISFIYNDKQYGILDYENKTISNMPEGVSVVSMIKEGNNLKITVDVLKKPKESNSQVFAWDYYVNGEEKRFNGISSHTREDKETYDEVVEINDFIIGSEYKLGWEYARMQDLKEKIIIDLKVQP